MTHRADLTNLTRSVPDYAASCSTRQRTSFLGRESCDPKGPHAARTDIRGGGDTYPNPQADRDEDFYDLLSIPEDFLRRRGGNCLASDNGLTWRGGGQPG